MPKKRWTNFKGQQSLCQNDDMGSASNTFSRIVSGTASVQDNYTQTWPELVTPARAGCSKTSRPSASDDGPARKMTKTEKFIDAFGGNVEMESLNTSLNITVTDSKFDFPPLSSSFLKITYRGKKFPTYNSVNNNKDESLSTQVAKKASRPKRNSTILIDVNSAIQASLMKKVKAPKRLVRRPERVLVGNPLDSSNPIRKKGKVRPHKKKNLTALKKLIIKERAMLKENSLMKDSILGNIHTDCTVTKNICDKNIVNDVDDLSLDNLKISDSYVSVKSKPCQSNDINRLLQEKIHSKKFPSYCDNTHSKDLDWAVGELVQTLRRFQDRAYAESAVKALARRRYVLGIHECHRHLVADHIRLVIIPFNIEEANALWTAIENLKVEASKREVPVVYASRCQTLSKCLFKRNRTCAVGIINYDGADDVFRKVMALCDQEKKKYESLLSSAKEELGLLEIKKEKRPSVEECLAKSIIEKLKLEETLEEEKILESS